MPQESAGILLWRRRAGRVELLLAHFGGPYWATKDDGAWSIPKGLIEPGETAEDAARREFAEEMVKATEGQLTPQGRIRQKGGNWVTAFALEGDFDLVALRSNQVTLAWPPRSRRTVTFPEIDRAQWFDPDAARDKILPSLRPLIDLLEAGPAAT
jgi:predicted NUDIX family NTP pyrophosphohydrolase